MNGRYTLMESYPMFRFDRLTTAFQPRRLMIAPAADGCKRWLGIGSRILRGSEQMLEKPLR
jgi:hypothetical protein